MEILLLVLGAVVGVAVDRGWDYARSAGAGTLEARRKLLHTSRASFSPSFGLSWVPEGLAQAATHDGTPLPLIEVQGGGAGSTIRPHDEQPLRFVSGPEVPGTIEAAELRRLEKLTGRKLFGGTCCFVKDIGDFLGRRDIEVTASGFERYASMYAAALEQRGDRSHPDPEQWDRWATAHLRRVMSGQASLQVGCAVALVQEIDGVWMSLQHTRSQEVMITPGLVGVLPVFGIEPSNRYAHSSRLGLLQYNLLREMGEELFSIPELETSVVTKRFDADWILTCLPVREVYDRWVDGSVEVRYFGPVINLVTANLQLIAAVIDRSGRWTELLQTAVANWEVAASEGVERPLRFRPVGELTSRWDNGFEGISPAAVLLDTRLKEYLKVPG